MANSPDSWHGGRLPFDRTFALENIEIMRTGDGRTVEAYAAVFGTKVEVTDRHGHYNEVISQRAFNKTIAERANRVNVFYHHGLTLHGTPSDLGSVPIGSPLEIKADNRGLLTITRYNNSPLADAVLEAIRNGDIRAQSFRGAVYKSSPNGRVPIQRSGQPLPTITRLELGLTEYGPTPTPVYQDASIMAVRSAERVAASIARLNSDEREELVSVLSTTHEGESETDSTTPAAGAGTEESRSVRSGRQRMVGLKANLRTRGVA